MFAISGLSLLHIVSDGQFLVILHGPSLIHSSVAIHDIVSYEKQGLAPRMELHGPAGVSEGISTTCFHGETNIQHLCIIAGAHAELDGLHCLLLYHFAGHHVELAPRDCCSLVRTGTNTMTMSQAVVFFDS